MTAKTDLPPLPERFDCTNGSAQWCYGCYTMTRDDLGDYVLAEDYDALRSASEALQAEIEALRADVAEWKRVAAAQAELHCEAEARAERLEKALRDAETSMQTIADKAGRDEYLMTMDEVRGYANSRANAARAALAQEDSND